MFLYSIIWIFTISNIIFIINSFPTLSPEILEAQLDKYLGAAFFIASLPDAKWGQIVAIAIEGNEKPVFPDFQSLGLKAAEVPRKYALVPHFERTETQKIKRQEILQSLSNADWRPL